MSRVIVVGLDGSACSDAALACAVELARGLGDRLVAAFGVEPPNRDVGEEWGEARAALEELGGSIVDAAVERAREAGLEADGALVPRRPVDALLTLAEELDARLIVVGTASERPLAGLVLGSVPYKLLHRSAVPVLVVPVSSDA